MQSVARHWSGFGGRCPPPLVPPPLVPSSTFPVAPTALRRRSAFCWIMMMMMMMMIKEDDEEELLYNHTLPTLISFLSAYLCVNQLCVERCFYWKPEEHLHEGWKMYLIIIIFSSYAPPPHSINHDHHCHPQNHHQSPPPLPDHCRGRSFWEWVAEPLVSRRSREMAENTVAHCWTVCGDDCDDSMMMVWTRIWWGAPPSDWEVGQPRKGWRRRKRMMRAVAWDGKVHPGTQKSSCQWWWWWWRFSST